MLEPIHECIKREDEGAEMIFFKTNRFGKQMYQTKTFKPEGAEKRKISQAFNHT